jgi:hypothetical protein
MHCEYKRAKEGTTKGMKKKMHLKHLFFFSFKMKIILTKALEESSAPAENPLTFFAISQFVIQAF